MASAAGDNGEHDYINRIDWIFSQALTETRLLPAKTQCFIAFLRERLTQALVEAGG